MLVFDAGHLRGFRRAFFLGCFSRCFFVFVFVRCFFSRLLCKFTWVLTFPFDVTFVGDFWRCSSTLFLYTCFSTFFYGIALLAILFYAPSGRSFWRWFLGVASWRCFWRCFFYVAVHWRFFFYGASWWCFSTGAFDVALRRCFLAPLFGVALWRFAS